MNDAQAIAYAKAALDAWALPSCVPRLIKNRENAVFEVAGHGGTRAALRLHRPGYQTDDAIRSELIWTQELGKAGMQLPNPINCKNGDIISYISDAGRMASIVTWVDGVPLGDGGIAEEWGASMQVKLFGAMGAKLAELHKLSDALTLPTNFNRAHLGLDALLGDNPSWGRFWENSALTADQTTLLLDARQTLVNLLKAHPACTADYGLIHADALSENVLVLDGNVTLIDFDDGVFGFRMYELGVAMSQVWDRPNAQELANALTKGYGISPDLTALLPVFTVIRTLASCGWAISRYEIGDSTLASYADRAVRATTRFMAGDPLFGTA